MRIRIRELMDAHGIPNAHALHQSAPKRISMGTAYNLVRTNGQQEYFSASVCLALMDVFDLRDDFNALFERDKRKRG